MMLVSAPMASAAPLMASVSASSVAVSLKESQASRNSKEVQNSENQGQRWTKSINLFGGLGWVKMLTLALCIMNNET